MITKKRSVLLGLCIVLFLAPFVSAQFNCSCSDSISEACGCECDLPSLHSNWISDFLGEFNATDSKVLGAWSLYCGEIDTFLEPGDCRFLLSNVSAANVSIGGGNNNNSIIISPSAWSILGGDSSDEIAIAFRRLFFANESAADVDGPSNNQTKQRKAFISLDLLTCDPTANISAGAAQWVELMDEFETSGILFGVSFDDDRVMSAFVCDNSEDYNALSCFLAMPNITKQTNWALNVTVGTGSQIDANGTQVYRLPYNISIVDKSALANSNSSSMEFSGFMHVQQDLEWMAAVNNVTAPIVLNVTDNAEARDIVQKFSWSILSMEACFEEDGDLSPRNPPLIADFPCSCSSIGANVSGCECVCDVGDNYPSNWTAAINNNTVINATGFAFGAWQLSCINGSSSNNSSNIAINGSCSWYIAQASDLQFDNNNNNTNNTDDSLWLVRSNGQIAAATRKLGLVEASHVNSIVRITTEFMFADESQFIQSSNQSFMLHDDLGAEVFKVVKNSSGLWLCENSVNYTQIVCTRWPSSSDDITEDIRLDLAIGALISNSSANITNGLRLNFNVTINEDMVEGAFIVNRFVDLAMFESLMLSNDTIVNNITANTNSMADSDLAIKSIQVCINQSACALDVAGNYDTQWLSGSNSNSTSPLISFGAWNLTCLAGNSSSNSSCRFLIGSDSVHALSGLVFVLDSRNATVVAQRGLPFDISQKNSTTKIAVAFKHDALIVGSNSSLAWSFVDDANVTALSLRAASRANGTILSICSNEANYNVLACNDIPLPPSIEDQFEELTKDGLFANVTLFGAESSQNSVRMQYNISMYSFATESVILQQNFQSLIVRDHLAWLMVEANKVGKFIFNNIEACKSNVTVGGVVSTPSLPTTVPVQNSTNNGTSQPLLWDCDCSSTVTADCGCVCDAGSNYNSNWQGNSNTTLTGNNTNAFGVWSFECKPLDNANGATPDCRFYIGNSATNGNGTATTENGTAPVLNAGTTAFGLHAVNGKAIAMRMLPSITRRSFFSFIFDHGPLGLNATSNGTNDGPLVALSLWDNRNNTALSFRISGLGQDIKYLLCDNAQSIGSVNCIDMNMMVDYTGVRVNMSMAAPVNISNNGAYRQIDYVLVIERLAVENSFAEFSGSMLLDQSLMSMSLENNNAGQGVTNTSNDAFFNAFKACYGASNSTVGPTLGPTNTVAPSSTDNSSSLIAVSVAVLLIALTVLLSL